jgi:hypothetical protein
MTDSTPQDYEALKAFAALAIRMRRAQIENSGRYHAGAWARAKQLEEHFDQHARELFGEAGEVRQPGSIERLQR